jgi:hypothetical protein
MDSFIDPREGFDEYDRERYYAEAEADGFFDRDHEYEGDSHSGIWDV